MRAVVLPNEDGLTVGQWIARSLSVSSKMLKYLKYRPMGICVNGEQKTVRHILRTGDVISLLTEDTEPSEAVEAVDLPLPILYEDADIVVPSKPADMPTHPSHDHHRDTVANALAFRYREMGVPFVFRPINRLDRNTSGLLLIARNKLSAARLTASLRRGEIQKTYLAVLDGIPEKSEGRIDAPLHRTAESIIVREVCSPDAPDADEAHTEYRVLAVGSGHALVVARPLTGRTHQLRVHFASIGCPITGDDLYGSPSDDIPRHALHAAALTFPHPSDGKILTLHSPLPDDFLRLIDLYFPDWEGVPNALI